MIMTMLSLIPFPMVILMMTLTNTTGSDGSKWMSDSQSDDTDEDMTDSVSHDDDGDDAGN